MQATLFPPSTNAAFRGHNAALWLCGVAIFMKLAIGINSMLNPELVALRADHIPVDRYPADAAAQVLRLLQLLGFGHVLFALFGAALLARYRTLVPLFLLVLLLERARQLASRAFNGMAYAPNAADVLTTAVLTGVPLLALALCFWPRRGRG